MQSGLDEGKMETVRRAVLLTPPGACIPAPSLKVSLFRGSLNNRIQINL